MSKFCRTSRQWMVLVGGVAILLAVTGCTTPEADQPELESESDVAVSEEMPLAARLDEQDLKRLNEFRLQLTRNEEGNIVEAVGAEEAINDGIAELLSGIATLEKLTLRESAMTLEGWKSLGRLVRLEQLDLRGCQLRNPELAAIASQLTKLRALRLNGQNGRTTVDDDGLAVLAGCPDLKALMLDHLWVGEAGLRHLMQNQQLAELYLAGTLVDDAALELVAQLPAMTKLRLAQTSIGADGVQALTALPLEELDISECSQVDDESLKWVGQLTKLRRLNLWRDAVTDAGLAHLASLTELRWLNLDNTQLSDAGLGYLRDMSQLEFLHLGSTGITDQGMPQLGVLESLKKLIVTRTAVTQAGVDRLQTELPNTRIQLEYVGSE